MDLGEFLLPGDGLRPRGLIIAPGLVAILAETTAATALCPGCKLPSGRVTAATSALSPISLVRADA